MPENTELQTESQAVPPQETLPPPSESEAPSEAPVTQDIGLPTASASETVPAPSSPAIETEQAEPKLSVQIPAPASPLLTNPAPPSPKSLWAKALESIRFRKRAKLEKIIKLANEKGSVTNDRVQKLLRVSDATAAR